MTYESELSALNTAFFQRQNRYPTVWEQVELNRAAYEAVYGPARTCGHQITEQEFEYYQAHPDLDRLCKRCVLEERAR